MPTTAEFALFSTNAYGKPQGALAHNLANFWKRLQLPIHPRYLENPVTGFQAHVYHNEAAQQVVITFSGTQLNDRGDLEACRDIWKGRLPKQFWNAYDLYFQVLDYMKGKGVQVQISFTGHSLGGALAQYMAIAAQGRPAVTFAAPGVLDALEALQGIYNPGYSYPVVNHVARGDEFGNYGRHVGAVNYYFFDQSDDPYAERPLADNDYEITRIICSALVTHSMERYFKEIQRLEGSSFRGKVTHTYKNGVAYEVKEEVNWTGRGRRKIMTKRWP
jgi:hypothetical protein